MIPTRFAFTKIPNVPVTENPRYLAVFFAALSSKIIKSGFVPVLIS